MKIFHQLPKLQCEQLLSQITHFVILILVTDKFQQILSWQQIANKLASWHPAFCSCSNAGMQQMVFLQKQAKNLSI